MIFMEKNFWGLYGFAPPGWKDRLTSKYLNWKGRCEYAKHLARNGR